MIEPVEWLGVIGIIFQIFGFIFMVFLWKTNPTLTQVRNWELNHHRALYGEPDSWILIDNRKELNDPKAGPDSYREVHHQFVKFWNLRTKTLPFSLVIIGLALQGLMLFLN